MRLVLDTNVVVSGLLWGGVPRRLLDLGRDGRVMLFTSSVLLDELADVLPRDRFRQLLSRVADGDNEASAELVSEYGGHILKAVRRRMNRSLRDRFDSQDFEQAVWASFFGHISVVQRIDSSGELAGFLTRMARN